MKMIMTTLAMLFTVGLTAQLLNGTFDETTTDQYGHPVPADWYTNNDADHRKCQVREWGSDNIVVLSPKTTSAFFDCNASMWQPVLLPDGLSNDSKLYVEYSLVSDSVNTTPFMIVEAIAYSEGTYVGVDRWQAEVFTNELELLSLSLTNTACDSLSIRIISGSQNGDTDGCHFPSYAYINTVRLGMGGGTTSTSVPTTADISVYPNPAFGYLTIGGDVEQIKSYEIFDSTGRMLQSGQAYFDSVQLLSSGLLILQVQYKDGSKESFKILNQG